VEVKVLVACATEDDKVIKPLSSVIVVGAVVDMQLEVITFTQAAAIPVSAVDLLLEYGPLLCLSALGVGELAVLL